jgi:hypothetical protein
MTLPPISHRLGRKKPHENDNGRRKETGGHELFNLQHKEPPWVGPHYFTGHGNFNKSSLGANCAAPQENLYLSIIGEYRYCQELSFDFLIFFYAKFNFRYNYRHPFVFFSQRNRKTLGKP